MTLSDVLTNTNGGLTPTTFYINDFLRGGRGGGGVIMKRQNDVKFSKIVWRRPLTNNNQCNNLSPERLLHWLLLVIR